ncbi:MAG: hypothetical protein B7Z74_09825 [Deltaproteobacteria bacterium 21-66-5]|nr:MAG: hypothetical protein B7Z74_09825 [Deltaproteobacteria bacterium 21-66-5]
MGRRLTGQLEAVGPAGDRKGTAESVRHGAVARIIGLQEGPGRRDAFQVRIGPLLLPVALQGLAHLGQPEGADGHALIVLLSNLPMKEEGRFSDE